MFYRYGTGETTLTGFLSEGRLSHQAPPPLPVTTTSPNKPAIKTPPMRSLTSTSTPTAFSNLEWEVEKNGNDLSQKLALSLLPNLEKIQIEPGEA